MDPDPMNVNSQLNHVPDKGSLISADSLYRYQLWRIWDLKKPLVLFIMLNPSTADSEKDDPTIIRCKNFTKSWGFGGFYVGNLFAFRSRYPDNLFTHPDPIGPFNLHHLRAMRDKTDLVIAAWGNKKLVTSSGLSRFEPLSQVEGMALYSIDTTPQGWCKHPLYLKWYCQPKLYSLYPGRG